MTESEKPISKEMFYESYKNMSKNIGEIKDDFKEAINKIDKHMEDLKITGNQTLEQARKTNGRVNKHDWYFKLIWWSLGAFWTLTLIFAPIVYRYITNKLRIINNIALQQNQIIN